MDDWEQRYRENDTPWITGYPSTQLIKILDGFITVSGPVLEVGCGTGANTLYMASRGLNVTGIDVSETAVELARHEAAVRQIECTFLCQDVRDISTDLNGTFALIFDRGFFHCLQEDRAKQWAQLALSLLDEGGHMLLLTGNDHEPSEKGPPKLSSRYLLSTFIPCFSIVRFHEFRWDPLSGDTWRPLAWSLLVQRRRSQP